MSFPGYCVELCVQPKLTGIYSRICVILSSHTHTHLNLPMSFYRDGERWREMKSILDCGSSLSFSISMQCFEELVRNLATWPHQGVAKAIHCQLFAVSYIFSILCVFFCALVVTCEFHLLHLCANWFHFSRNSWFSCFSWEKSQLCNNQRANDVQFDWNFNFKWKSIQVDWIETPFQCVAS